MNAKIKTLLLSTILCAFLPTSTPAQVQIEKEPDLVIENILVKYRRTPNVTRVLKVKVTAENRGSGKSKPMFVDLILSADDQLSTRGEDIKFAQIYFKGMKPGQERVKVISQRDMNGLAVRDMYILAVVDSRSQNEEENEANNFYVSRQIP